ncbi:hypothetical protein ACFFQF_27930 [Haladaptatus pallidirubidus]|uniref:Uncharacterized protein n=1 Tax=Haladaptatus pallidirubidus TaxID=1008152 RepID=A0AAV3UJ84_9EURY|nr:hypothetical protein [Haladaptatus pallidirubidus]
MGLLQSASKTIVGIDILFLLLLGFSFLYLEPGSGSYVTATITLVPIVLTFVGGVLILYTGWEPFE